MRVEPPAESPRNDETPSQKQDPLERRRLQNRLSQRNHRRKIRDRIAKLQERVIANELRAAAALNGWDQPFTSSPLLSPRHTSHQQNDLSASRDPSPMTTEPSTPFVPSCSATATSLWTSDLNFPHSPGWLSGDAPSIVDGSGFANDSICSMPRASYMPSGIQLPAHTGIHEGDTVQDVIASPNSLYGETSSAPSNQPLYYVTTGERTTRKNTF
ncbi:hypothetical protein N7532_007757 [Penicillium argentinense]|uniref:BZIP domain-containing protein n=1 Tax=Penicillium argentinense TaxID=1131581 RepID=A0A9W9EW20_9EURO|nr:uncharacterized protein N7532_007757 [Penicillium argentinense]KAJ5089073.1 hypothetical protein N7532_007757 [Penicillium argentinense]